MTISAGRILRRQESVESAEMDGEWVLLDLDSHSITKVNEMGGYIWEQLEHHNTLGQLIDRIASEYDVDREVARRDAEVFIAELIRVGLVTHG
ncbi:MULTISPECIES: PqqD family protein [Paenibacillus]|uniref:PqqD family protein n=1 Tax=Paenibacillus TaxID=44249 RepID=UPI0004264CFF|nr:MULTISPECIES: PqqD family protein [Paenibacillus]KKC49278.1 hypothetical protein VE23_22905 [Paenibacillus sp. D9]CDN41899.1 Putative uncharacterized protein [Paenibacillus sp. P22]